MSPPDTWPRTARLLARLLRALAPERAIEPLLRDIDEAFRRRIGSRGAHRWLLRQLLLALRPRRVRELRRLGRPLPDDRPRPVTGLLAGTVTDLRHAVRLLSKSPAHTALSVVVLAGGLAVSLFTFSLLYTAMYAPLPVPEGDRLVRIVGIRDGRSTLLDAVDLAAIRDDLESFELVGAWENRYVRLRGEHETRSLYGTFAEPVMFDAAPVPPLRGRRLLPRDAAPGAEPVAVLGYRLWRSAFGGDPSVVGELVDINGVATRIVGVMPEEFGFPVFGQLWLPLDATALAARERGRIVSVFGKLRPGADAERADAELRDAMQRIRAETPDPEVADDIPRSAEARTFQKAQFGDEADLLFLTLHLAAAFILLLAIINGGNLLLARGLERAREISVRVALGAPRLRLVVQVMAEGTLVVLAAGALAVTIAGVALSTFDQRARALFPEGLAYWWSWGLDAPTLVAAAVLIGATILMVGGVPAAHVLGSSPVLPLQGAQPGHGTRGPDRLSRLVVVGQITLIATLLFLGGAAGWVSHRAANLDLGVDAERVLIGLLELPEADYPAPEARVSVVERITEHLARNAAVEGVLARATIGADTPLAIGGVRYDHREQQPTAQIRATLGDADLLGVELLAGRRFADGSGAPTALVSRSLARRLWGEDSPLGRRLRLGNHDQGPDGSPWRTVIGVVSDIVEGNPLARDRDHDTVYVPLAQVAPAAVGITFRHRGDARAAITALHDTLAATAPSLVPRRVVHLDEMMGTMARMATAMNRALLGCFGFALLLAVGGIYGLTSRSVTARTAEVGIRRALGATEQRVVGLFLREGAHRLAAGLSVAGALCLSLAVAATRYLVLDRALFALTGLAVVGLITAVVLVATYLPTRRCLELNPRAALWREH